MRSSWKRFKRTRSLNRLHRKLRPFSEARRQRFAAVRAELEERGWSFDSGPAGMVPVQAWGHLPSGEAFYFRCRWDECRLSVKLGAEPASAENIHDADWEDVWAADDWQFGDAGSADAQEVHTALLELEERFRKR